ncbi:MAG: hypothetical protein Q7S36_00010 [Candidatus Liptonbacteria bacterium]|nr:hypothetical protein [Candidatus Liptonbacteria bacterium]
MLKFLSWLVRPAIHLAIMGFALSGFILKDGFLMICGPIAAGALWAMLPMKVRYGKDGIAFNPNNGSTWIYDWRLYMQDPVRGENFRKQLDALKRFEHDQKRKPRHNQPL